jgi:selenocysteine-specific elongation factor
MPIVGTAGHVDHGKSLLIEALTGTNPDRLPEEKERGMTTDLGFAFFSDPEGRPIGVIDVPGHERFIRNMVAGAWSLDCALLVVAADDGWMAQSETHARVLKALDTPAVIPVISKIDLVSESRLREVEDSVRAKCAGFFGQDRVPVSVSALKGRGIGELKARILEVLAALPPRREEDTPYLYIDRVFSLKGTGLVLAGSLRGGGVSVGQDLALFPGGEALRVRGLHAYNSPVSGVSSGTRTALNVPRPKRLPERGDCLAGAGAPVRVAQEFLAFLQDSRAIRNHGEAEIAFASAHRLGKIHLLGGGPGARVTLEAPGALMPGMRFVVIRHGGSDILGYGTALWFDAADATVRRRFAAFLAKKDRVPSAVELEVAMRGYAARETRRADAVISGPPPSGEVLPEWTVEVDRWLFDKAFLAAREKEILEGAGKSGGVSIGELTGPAAPPEDILRMVVLRLVGNKKLALKGNRYVPAGAGGASASPGTGSNPATERLLEAVKAAGKAGYEPGKEPGPVPKEALNYLCRTALIIPVEGGIFFETGVYRALRGAVLAGRRPGDRFSVPEAKDRTGLSRKYIIPLLNKIEQEGYVKRAGDERVVIKGN